METNITFLKQKVTVKVNTIMTNFSAKGTVDEILFQNIFFLCNTRHCIVYIYKYYLDIGFIGVTRPPEEPVASSLGTQEIASHIQEKPQNAIS